MPGPGGVDRFDGARRAWIARHQGWSTIQRRRAEQLGRRIRARQRDLASAVPDPHDDTLMPPLWLRTAHSGASQIEVALVCLVCVLVPVGTVAGYAIKALVTRLVPDTLRGYPVVALLWGAVGLGVLTVGLYALTDGPGLGRIVGAPWVCAQVATAPAAAGLLGIAEGWLAVPASRRWFPRAPRRRALSAADAVQILGGYDRTGPGLLPARPLNRPGERTR